METLQPKLRFPNYINNYNNILFNEVVESYGYGPRFNANDYSENGNVKTIRGTDISLEGEIKYIQVPTALLDDNTVNTHKLLDGDLVMITTADCGLTGVFRKQNIDFIPSAYAVRIRLKDNTNSFYFKYFFQTKLAKNQVDKFIRKATVANLPGSDILKFNINLPNFEEQTKIANFLSSVDEKLNLLKEKKELLEDYKRGIMQKIFNQEIRFKDDNGNDFEDWKKVVLSEVFDYKKGSGLSKDKLDDNGVFECILYGELYTKYSEVIFEVKSKTNTNEGLLSEIGDLLIPSSTTTSGIDLANVTALNFDNILLGGDITVLRSNQEVSSVFYAYYLSNHKKEEIASYAQGITIVHLYYSHIKDMIIDLPSKEEQIKIANFLSAIDEKIELVSNQIQDTQEYKKGLLQKMFV